MFYLHLYENTEKWLHFGTLQDPALKVYIDQIKIS